MSRHHQRASSRAWRRLRAAVLDRDDYRCRKCRVRTAEQVHHLVPVARDGAYWDPENLIAVCRPCHRALHDTRTAAQREWDAYLEELEPEKELCSTLKSAGSMS